MNRREKIKKGKSSICRLKQLSDSTSGSSTGMMGRKATRIMVLRPNRKALHVIGPRPWT